MLYCACNNGNCAITKWLSTSVPVSYKPAMRKLRIPGADLSPPTPGNITTAVPPACTPNLLANLRLINTDCGSANHASHALASVNSSKCDNLDSATGSVANNNTGSAAEPITNKPCASISGLAAVTCGFFNTSCATACHSAISFSSGYRVIAGTTRKIRVRNSCSKPFITASTVINSATATTKPAIDTREIKPSKAEPLRACA